jgi:hypothetical protein
LIHTNLLFVGIISSLSTYCLNKKKCYVQTVRYLWIRKASFLKSVFVQKNITELTLEFRITDV